ncbi:MAG: S41 family peptidase, partial [Elusimicrobiota bacterium]|nr:S41 family peptidase [Elusimicrobiota bacterium]
MRRKSTFSICIVALVFLSTNLGFATGDKTYDQLKLLGEILGLAQERYVDEVDTQKLIYSACSGMLKPLDPFSQFMEPRVYREMKIETEGKYGGLGIRITIRDNWLTVVTPLPGTPAYRIGIQPEDKIIKIEGESTQGITMEEAVKKLRGDPGTKVKITIMREGVKEPVDYEITREIIKLESLRSKMIDEDIGYIRLLEFNQNSQADLKKALQELDIKGMKSLILDLRHNPGGLLDVAVEITKFFLGGNKMIVYTKGRIPESYKEYTSDKAPYWSEKVPLVVLVNKGSASGSEIVAGALQDHKRALIIGSRTFGKASVQSVLPLSDGCALKLTTAKYYTPSGRLIQVDTDTVKGGIEPDIKIEVPKEVEAKLQREEEKIYPPGKEPEKVEKTRDEVLERAVEILKA